MMKEWIKTNLKKITLPRLAQGLRKIWNMKVKTIPLVIGALGRASIKLRNWY